MTIGTDLEDELEAVLAIEFAPDAGAAARQGLSVAIARAKEANGNGNGGKSPVVKSRSLVPQPDPPERPARPLDPIAGETARCRNTIAAHERKILEIERTRDIAIRGFEADLAEATRAFDELKQRITRGIAEEDERASHLIAIRGKLVRSYRAALAALEPDDGEVEAPPKGRRVAVRKARS